MDRARSIRNIRLWLGFFVLALVLSGVTAFPLRWEVGILAAWLGEGTQAARLCPGLGWWISYVQQGLDASYGSYPFLAYGTDWLAFAHLIIAVAFWGPIKDPVKNIWVVDFGIIACLLVIPLALICGPLRGIPLYWRLIDCSFGVLGIIPLVCARRIIVRLTAEE
jgi:hypothetical protein